MRAICAWCRAEGAAADLGEREPLDDPVETHGLCERHLAEFLAAAPARPSTDLRLLIVVKGGDRSLYEHLTWAMAEVAGVQVLMERRRGQRRGAARPVARDRRQADRRQPRSVVQSIGCTFVRFSPAYSAPRAS